MSSPETVNSKVIILYIVQQARGLSWHQLMNISIGTLYMDYFTFTQLAGSLQADGLMQVARRKGETALNADGQPVDRCDLTPAGEQVLSSLSETLSVPVRRNIHRLVEPLLDGKQRQIQAGIQPDPRGGYRIQLRLDEGGHPLMTTELVVPTEEMARRITAAWEDGAESRYQAVLRALMPDA